jgi:hypothetical protein
MYIALRSSGNIGLLGPKIPLKANGFLDRSNTEVLINRASPFTVTMDKKMEGWYV